MGGGGSLCHVSYATLLCKWVSRLSCLSSARGNFSDVSLISPFRVLIASKLREFFLIITLVMKCFAQSAIKPTGRARTGGRNHEQTPTLEFGGN